MMRRHPSRPLGFAPDERYRTAPEAAIVAMIALFSSFNPHEAAAKQVAATALNAWIGLGLPVRATDQGVFFDPFEVINFGKAAGLGGLDPFYEANMVPAMRHHAMALSALCAKRQEIPFQVQLARLFNTKTLAAGKSLRLRMPLPRECANLTGISLSNIEIEGCAADRVEQSPGRLEIRGSAQRENVLVSATARFTAQGHPDGDPLVVQNDRLEVFLRPVEGLIVITERVAALSRHLAGPGTRPSSAIKAFWRYILQELSSGFIHYDQIDLAVPCDWILDAGWFDCQLASSLFVALCRAQGIAARVVGGRFLYPTQPLSHFWAEAWTGEDGWSPFDFAAWDLSGGGRDPSWCDFYAGRLDPRLVTEILPLHFTGSVGLPLPNAWYLLQGPADHGVEVRFCDAASGDLIYSDFASIVSPRA